VKRLCVLAALAVVVLGPVGCAPGDEAVLTINGDDVLSADELQGQLDQLVDAEDALTALDGRGAGAETLSAGFVASVLGNHALTGLIEADLAANEVPTTEEDVATGTEQLRQVLLNPAQQGLVPLELEDVPSGYRGTLIDLYSSFNTLIRDLGTVEAAQARVDELLVGADVEVADRYGHWDLDQGGVVPPEGPVSPTTTLLAPAPPAE
jgi:hypothetical protein